MKLVAHSPMYQSSWSTTPSTSQDADGPPEKATAEAAAVKAKAEADKAAAEKARAEAAAEAKTVEIDRNIVETTLQGPTGVPAGISQDAHRNARRGLEANPISMN